MDPSSFFASNKSTLEPFVLDLNSLQDEKRSAGNRLTASGRATSAHHPGSTSTYMPGQALSDYTFSDDDSLSDTDLFTSTPNQTPSRNHSLIHSELTAMLQQQQAMLLEIMKKQTAIESKQNTFETRHIGLETRLTEQQPVTTSKTNLTDSVGCPSGKRKRIVSRTLTVSCFCV